jgi:hypothetical protein
MENVGSQFLSLRQGPRSQSSPPMAVGPESVRTAVSFERTSGLERWFISARALHSPFFSPKLWTALDQHGPERPCGTDLCGRPPGKKFGHLSLESGGQEFESLRARQLSYWCCYRTQAVRSASTCVAHYREAPARESHPYLGGARPGVFFTTSALVCTIPNEDLNIFEDWLTAIVIANQARQANYPLTAIEARRALRQAGVRVFPSVGHRLAVEMHSAKPAEKISKWREVVGPVFQSIWPLDIELQSPVSTFKLVPILRATGNAFPEAADVVIPFIRPEDPRRHTSVHSISEADEVLYTSAPQKMLDLLAAVVGDAPVKSVYGLNKVLDRIRAVDSQLADTKKFQKLVSEASIH